ncbi:Mitochondrial import inner membrane translocase subunit tim54 [Smittium culicis]|uniref:Mitochondrial import inner membrane translocase subunit TIM54 n=1 Tax=Smittium culicis TaxID=133412 RepID=A0A1R1XX72_9FUNG|nr:Mitochondrial import inner membrane translocase subunit tim54 [Smittium culicis]
MSSSTRILDKIRKKIPSRNTLLFWGSAASLIGYHQYNKRQCKNIILQYSKIASEIANQPCGPLDSPRKVVVILTNQPGEYNLYKTREYWSKYVLPIFVAGALDYDLVEIRNTSFDQENQSSSDVGVGVMEGKVHEYVVGSVFSELRAAIELKYPHVKNARLAAESPSSTLFSQSSESSPEDLPFTPQKQHKLNDFIAIGRNSYAETLNGLSEGLFSNLDLTIKKPQHPSPENSSLEILETNPSTPTQNDISSTSNIDPTSPNHDILLSDPAQLSSANTQESSIIEYEKYKSSIDFPTPSIGYLPFFCYSGWSSIPIRIFNFFNDTKNTAYYSQQALNIVLDSKRPFVKSSDFDLGSDEETMNGWSNKHAEFVVSQKLSDNILIYDTC